MTRVHIEVMGSWGEEVGDRLNRLPLASDRSSHFLAAAFCSWELCWGCLRSEVREEFFLLTESAIGPRMLAVTEGDALGETEL